MFANLKDNLIDKDALAGNMGMGTWDYGPRNSHISNIVSQQDFYSQRGTVISEAGLGGFTAARDSYRNSFTAKRNSNHSPSLIDDDAGSVFSQVQVTIDNTNSAQKA